MYESAPLPGYHIYPVGKDDASSPPKLGSMMTISRHLVKLKMHLVNSSKQNVILTFFDIVGNIYGENAYLSIMCKIFILTFYY